MGNTRSRTVGDMQSRTSTSRKTIPEPTPQPVAQVIELQRDDDDGATALDAVLSELGGIDNGRVGVYRIDRAGGLEYVATLTPDEVQGEASLLEAIRRDYGGGSYRIHVRDAAGLIANRRVSIAERKAPPPDAVPNMVTAMMERMQAQTERIVQALTVNQRPAVSEADAEEKVLARMQTMANILGTRSSGIDTSVVMETLSQGIELGKQLSGAAGGQDSTGAVMAESLKAFTAMMLAQQRAPVRRPVPVPARQVAAVPPQAVPQPEGPATTAEDGADELAAMRTLLQVVMTGARRESDPELYAELVADQLGVEGVAELLRMPDPVGMLVQLEPEADEHRTWLQGLAQALRELQDEQRAADGDAPSEGPQRADGHPGRPGRGVADARPDAGPGA